MLALTWALALLAISLVGKLQRVHCQRLESNELAHGWDDDDAFVQSVQSHSDKEEESNGLVDPDGSFPPDTMNDTTTPNKTTSSDDVVVDEQQPASVKKGDAVPPLNIVTTLQRLTATNKLESRALSVTNADSKIPLPIWRLSVLDSLAARGHLGLRKLFRHLQIMVRCN
jgi:hypothetical protein